MKRYLSFLIIFTLILTMTGCKELAIFKGTANAETTVELEGKVSVSFIDVGQGDSILIQTDGNTMLIDGGEASEDEKLMAYLESTGVEKIDVMVATHPHSDHIGGLVSVLETYPVSKVILPDVTHTTSTFKNFVGTIKENKIEVQKVSAGDTFLLGDAKFTVLAPNGTEYEDLNNYSVCMKMEYGNTSFMFTGDAEALSESEMIASGADLSADVLKVGHHGSHSSTSDEFLDAVNPSAAIISCGEDNSYGHPHEETLRKLEERGIPVYRTDLLSNIEVISDGLNITYNDEIIN